MPTITLHHYPESLYSEKIRVILGYKNLTWNSVIIPVIMPKPLLMPMTGGYRKTPVMQAGADIFCDTELIARAIEKIAPDPPLFDDSRSSVEQVFAQWTDFALLRYAATLIFSPEALKVNARMNDPERAEAFAKDRAELSKNSEPLTMPLEIALSHFRAHMARLEHQLKQGGDYLFGSTPSIADISTYHCLWFISGNSVTAKLLHPYRYITDWYQRMQALGHGKPIETTGEDALNIAGTSSPNAHFVEVANHQEEFSPGTEVAVTPTDYGKTAVVGSLLAATPDQISILRHESGLGDIAVHFPRFGFELSSIN